MEKKINTIDTSALKKSLYENPAANFRIKVENSKKVIEKSKYEDNFRNNFPGINKYANLLNIKKATI